MKDTKKIVENIIQDVISLTPMQEGMLFHYLKEPHSDFYFEQLCLEITGELDVQAVEDAWNVVIKNNEMLRALFRWEGLEKPVLVVLKEHKIKPDYYDFSKEKEIAKVKVYNELTVQDREKGFDLRAVPFRVTLCKMTARDFVMVVSNHHILYDGWSNGIIFTEFFKAFRQLSNRENVKFPAKTGYKKFVKWLKQRDVSQQEIFWKEYLRGLDKETVFQHKRSGAAGDGAGKVANEKAVLPASFKEELEAYCKKNKITPAAFLYSAWGVLLQKYCNSEDVLLGTTVSGRSADVKGIEDMVGLFINTIPLRVKTTVPGSGGENGATLAALLTQVNKDLLARGDYEHTPLVDIKAYSQLESSGELFNSIVVIESYPLDSLLTGENDGLLLQVRSYNAFEMTHYDLTLGITPGEEMEVDFCAGREVMDSAALHRLAGHFVNVAGQMLYTSEMAVAQVELLSTEEKELILYDFNDTDAEYPTDETVYELFLKQVQKTPDNIAVIDMESVPGASLALTYRRLSEKADGLSAYFKEQGVAAGSVAAVMLEPSSDVLATILGLWRWGAIYLPLSLDDPLERRKYVLKDSCASFLITRKWPTERVESMSEDITCIDLDKFEQREWYGHEGMDETGDETVTAAMSDPAYVIYTSGSTGKPKGVAVGHRALVNRLFWLQRHYAFDSRDVVLQKSALTFDVSMCELFRWVPWGGRVVFPVVGTGKDPAMITDVIQQCGVTVIEFIPSMLDTCLSYLEDHDGLARLSGLKWVIAGAEVIHPAQVKRFNQSLFSRFGVRIINSYGPTEATVDVTYFDCSGDCFDNRQYDTVPIGRPIDNTQIYILDPHGNVQPLEVAGELCISGRCLAQGYLNRPELTAEKFVSVHSSWLAALRKDKKGKAKKGEDSDAHSKNHTNPMNCELRAASCLYKTGDLACWLPDGNIEFLGRLDQQVKIRGFRIELAEIENRLLEFEKIKKAVVVVRNDRNRENYLCAYVVSLQEIDLTRLRDDLSLKLPAYMIPANIMRLDKMPVTSSGKIDRKALPEPEISAGTNYIAPRNKIECILTEIWAEVLGIKNEVISIDDNFFQLGGHSLKATILAAKIHKLLDIKIPLVDIFNKPSIRGISEYFSQTRPDYFNPVEAVEEREYYVLSAAQKRMYTLQQMEEVISTAYNLPNAALLEGEISRLRFEAAFDTLIKRHDSFRTSFGICAGKPVQIIHPGVDFKIQYHCLNSHSQMPPGDDSAELDQELQVQRIVGKFVAPFNLARAPLLRLALIRISQDKHIMLFDMHHIISDGVSISILVSEFADLYNGEKLPPLALQYKDASSWQNKYMESESFIKQFRYWNDRFSGHIPTLNIPTDYPRPPVKSFKGKKVDMELDPRWTGRLKQLTKETDTTIFMVLLAVYNILLACYSGQEDIIVGVPAAARSHADFKNIIGLFVNTLPIRNYPGVELTFLDFLQSVKTNALNAYDNQDYPFDRLVNKLNLSKNINRNPLFDVLFVSEDTDVSALEMDELTISSYPLENNISHLDLVLYIMDSGDGIGLILEYDTALFKHSTARETLEHFIEILRQVVERREIKLGDIKLSHDLIVPRANILTEDHDDFAF